MVLFRAILMPVYADCEYEMKISRVEIEYLKFTTISETKCGHWIMNNGKNKWVSKNSMKRFAYPTKEQALSSLKCRTRSRLFHLKINMQIATQGMKLIDTERGS